jgi:phosphate transport system substrate-binding protein
VACSRTEEAFENLIDGYSDLVFLMGVSEEQKVRAEAAGVELQLTPIGREAFVFFVHRRNPVSDLSVQDVKRIYSGEVTNWQQVGGKDDPIRAYQRPENSGSQTALLQLMGDLPLMAAPEKDIYSTMEGMYHAVADYKNYKNSLGYSFRFYVNEMINENQVKLLALEGINPTVEHIAAGTYPAADDFYAVTAVLGEDSAAGDPRAENTAKLLEWIRSPQGQSLVQATGYVPLL